MTKKQIVVPLVPGFEEIEAITILDVLRRAELTVLAAGAEVGPVRGAHGIEVVADTAWSNLPPVADIGMVVLPGGMPGAKNLATDSRVQTLLKDVAQRGGYTAAICAAPIALAAAGLLRGKRATCYPGFEKDLGGASFCDDPVVIDGTVVTSRGPGTALLFALTLVEILRGEPEAERLGFGMLYAPPA
jgi:4-methyl-5(b-hydroxyethyl)-thiazole monophosphate biosynthesis